MSIGRSATFAGYRRDDGRYGIRNHVLVLGLNGLVARSAARIAAGVAGTVLFASPYGRGQFGEDAGRIRRSSSAWAGIRISPRRSSSAPIAA